MFQEIIVEKRAILGKKAQKALKKEGKIPAIVYGGGKDPVPITVLSKDIITILHSERGLNSVLLFSLKGTKSKRHVMIKDFQINPLNSKLIHADFKRIELEEKVRVKIPVALTGVPFGVKTEGGRLEFIIREIHIECMPSTIPSNITLDISELKLNQSIKLSELVIPEGVKILEDDLSIPVVAIVTPRVVEEVTTAPAEEELVEPEVIKKGKAEEEEEKEEEGSKE